MSPACEASSPQDTDLVLRFRLERSGFVLDVDLRLPGQGVTALFGPSGSGKTTCLRVLAGMESLARGHVSVAGEIWQDSAQKLFLPTHRRAIGYVFQEASLFEHLSVEDNLKFGFRRTPPEERRHGWDHGLDLLGIGHLLRRMPGELSGGERQRVAIARALAASPRVLLMDEPLAALDAKRKADILPWLERLHERLDLPVVYVTHSMEELTRVANHLVLLDQGRPLASGPVAGLLTRLELPLMHGDTAVALVEARVGDTRNPADPCMLEFPGGHLLLPEAPGTRHPPGTHVRVCVHARDVSLCLVAPRQTSILNVLPATVLAMTDAGPGQVLISLELGPPGQTTRLLSLISRLSSERLDIRPGLPVFAQIKAIAMIR